MVDLKIGDIVTRDDSGQITSIVLYQDKGEEDDKLLVLPYNFHRLVKV
jgi:hypothetical protein